MEEVCNIVLKDEAISRQKLFVGLVPIVAEELCSLLQIIKQGVSVCLRMKWHVWLSFILRAWWTIECEQAHVSTCEMAEKLSI